MGFFSKILDFDNKKYLLAIDLGTEFVKTLIFYPDRKEEKVIIIGSGKERHNQDNIRGGIICNINGVVETCKKAIHQAELMVEIKPEIAIVGIGGESIINVTESADIKRKEIKKRININELQSIVALAQENVSKTAKKMFKGKSEWDNPKLIGLDVIDFSIDGYRVVNPINFKGENIRVNISNTYLTGVYGDLVKNITENLKLKLSNLSYGPYAVLKAIGAQDSIKFNAIFIDIGGNTTDVVAIKNGNIKNSKAFLAGGKTFTRSIAGGLKLDFSQAEKIKINYSNNKLLDDQLREKVKKLTMPSCDIWLKGIELSLRELSKASLLPSKIFLYGGGSHLPFMFDGLKRLLRIEKFSFMDEPEINFINPSDIIGAVDRTKSLNSLQDVTAMSLASLSLDLANEEDFPNKIIKKSQNFIT